MVAFLLGLGAILCVLGILIAGIHGLAPGTTPKEERRLSLIVSTLIVLTCVFSVTCGVLLGD